MSDSEFDEVVQYGSKRSQIIDQRTFVLDQWIYIDVIYDRTELVKEVASKVRIESSFDTVVRINITENIARRNALGFEVPQFLIEIVKATNNVLYGITTKIVKRMETRLRRRKEELSETPFSDDNIINRLLECSVQIIRYNDYNLDIIKKAICTIFFHIVSTDDKLLQNFSSSNWCKYKISHILKLDVYDIVIIFTDGNTGRLKKLRSKITILKELNKQKVNKVQLQAEILSKMIRSLER
ncbi:odorant receptor 13a-like [Vespula maculifrons]|uniref:Odorant receptor 13a-like n=1 Tax=Vespula maculifrons TaxID=7453 RepID=A0ABD2BPD3_VESMC